MPVYSDSGNRFVASQVPPDAQRVLDVGCGSGDTAALIKLRNPGVWIEGITLNCLEAARAEKVLDRVHVFDIEQTASAELDSEFDCLLFSHVVEHLREPAGAIQRLLPHLTAGGALVVAVPNLLEWRTRLRLLRGEFAYADYGILDRTHLRFFTFDSIDDDLLSGELRAGLSCVEKLGDGAVPLGPLRRLSSMRRIANAIDKYGVSIRPNLFAQQIVVVARKGAAP